MENAAAGLHRGPHMECAGGRKMEGGFNGLPHEECGRNVDTPYPMEAGFTGGFPDRRTAHGVCGPR